MQVLTSASTNEQEAQINLQAYKPQRLNYILNHLSNAGLRSNTYLSVSEIKKLLDNLARGTYDPSAFEAIIQRCQPELQSNRNEITLYQFFDKYVEIEFNLLNEREYYTTLLTDNTQQFNDLQKEINEQNALMNSANRPHHIFKIEIMDFVFGPEIQTDLDEDRFELFISSRRTSKDMMLRHSHLEYMISQGLNPIFELEIEDVNEAVKIQISDLYEKRANRLYVPSDQFLSIRDLADEKDHNLILSFVNDMYDDEEILVNLKVKTRFIPVKVKQQNQELIALKERERFILDARDKSIKKLHTVQKIFDNRAIDVANSNISMLSSPDKNKTNVRGINTPKRASYRPNLFASPQAENPVDENDDEIYALFTWILSKVKYINYIYIILATISCFYRNNFIDITIGLAFYMGAKINHKLVYFTEMTCVFIFAILYSLILDFLWIGLNHGQFFMSHRALEPDSTLMKVMMIVSYILMFYKSIVMLSYIKYIRKHKEDSKMLKDLEPESSQRVSTRPKPATLSTPRKYEQKIKVHKV